jgi:hypothetical protein
MNKTALKAMLATLFIALLIVGLIHLSQPERHNTIPSGAANSAAKALTDQEMTRRLLALEAQRNQFDQTVWAREQQAQEYEAPFIKLWDDLRKQTNFLEVLDTFPFGELRLGTWSEPVTIEDKVSRRRSNPPIERLNPETFRQRLAKLQSQGLRLEQSEWRQARFAVAADGVAESVFVVTLHAFIPGPEERFILRGELRVQWRTTADPIAGPFPEVIDATSLELLTRQGQLPFAHKRAADLTPKTLDPELWGLNLQLYDLDGDGLSEIVLARRNLVYRNKGRGTFKPEPLFARPLAALDTGVIADFDGDGAADYLAVDAQGLALFTGDQRGHFANPARRIRFAREDLANPFVLTAGDIDGDGDLDVWLAQYKVPYQNGQMPTPYYDANDGYPAFLLVNDGKGNFQDRTESAGLAAKRFRRTYSSSFVDLDDDGDLDLLVVSDFAGADLYLNDGQGHFTDSRELLDEPHAFGMAHTFGDFDGDGQLDVLMIGMNSHVANRLDELGLGRPEFAEHQRMRAKMAFGNRLYLRAGSRFQQSTMSERVARTGWSWGSTAGDFDNDGDLDLYIVNGHISGETARDYETQYWRHDIYTGTSQDDPVLALFFRSMQTQHLGAGESHGGFEKNRLFLNQSGKSFIETGYLMGVALEEDCRSAVSDDLDGDGKLDLVLTTFKTRPRPQQALHLFPNVTEDAGHWLGVRLRESGPGFSPLGAKVILTTVSGKQIRTFVSGDSYRSQHAPTAHFGLGMATEVKSVEVVWPNGQRKTILNPAIDRYHSLTPSNKQ